MAEPHSATEPVHGETSRFEGFLNRVLVRAVGVLTSVVALLLVVFVVVALAGAGLAAMQPLGSGHDFTGAAIEGLDRAFLVVILLELAHTTLSRGPITRQVQEFLLVGVTSGVRAGLETVAQRGGDARSTAVSLALNAVGVFVLVGALCLVRQRLYAERR